MDRHLAIARLARLELAALAPDERARHLARLRAEDWRDDPGWGAIDRGVRDELEADERRGAPQDPRYDDLLRLALARSYVGATGAYLAARLRALGESVDAVHGEPEPLAPCPCCGCRTLAAPDDFQICPVCWWEDDGRDTADADATGGPNGELSLAAARIHVLTTGIAVPDRDDLRARQHPAARYARGRTFVLRPGGDGVDEVGGPA